LLGTVGGVSGGFGQTVQKYFVNELFWRGTKDRKSNNDNN